MSRDMLSRDKGLDKGLGTRDKDKGQGTRTRDKGLDKGQGTRVKGHVARNRSRI